MPVVTQDGGDVLGGHELAGRQLLHEIVDDLRTSPHFFEVGALEWRLCSAHRNDCFDSLLCLETCVGR
jgi:hypothetical protein